MKTKYFLYFLVVLGMSCSKKDDPSPAATGGCSVTFKGTAYTMTTALCVEASSGGLNVDGVGATGANGTSFQISRDLDDPAGSSLILNTGSQVYIAAEGITSQPTISRNGKSWTFSGTAGDGSGDTGAISGTCTCTN